ncbi:hypothetical protein PAAG_05811 [Paracoccidioides lutzii Pb01]|uniref:Uncharacterized protein n=1 Tax=Paracoccidioides lutzii (strain ATCC MYA-826 / Pb01) TaxID=502779 RepID=C1H4X0_PARBA|nr:hypothetical protein PAAG_05811 [Paracoccidioides lutzii Pb01]EEH34764.2 hypothetical protein PAAG_05811 [Paracoccidioides lutzii Pb01]
MELSVEAIWAGCFNISPTLQNDFERNGRPAVQRMMALPPPFDVDALSVLLTR